MRFEYEWDTRAERAFYIFLARRLRSMSLCGDVHARLAVSW